MHLIPVAQVAPGSVQAKLFPFVPRPVWGPEAALPAREHPAQARLPRAARREAESEEGPRDKWE